MKSARSSPLLAVLIGVAFAGTANADSVGTKLKNALGIGKNDTPAAGTPQAQPSQPSQSPHETLDPASDRFCDSLDRAYSVTDDLSSLTGGWIKCQLQKCNPDEQMPKDPSKLD